MRFVSDEKGKFAKMVYSSIVPEVFFIFISLSVRYINFMSNFSANLTRAISSGDDA